MTLNAWKWWRQHISNIRKWVSVVKGRRVWLTIHSYQNSSHSTSSESKSEGICKSLNIPDSRGWQLSFAEVWCVKTKGADINRVLENHRAFCYQNYILWTGLENEWGNIWETDRHVLQHLQKEKINENMLTGKFNGWKNRGICRDKILSCHGQIFPYELIISETIRCGEW